MRASLNPGTTYRLMVQTKDGRDALFVPAASPLWGEGEGAPEFWFHTQLNRWKSAVHGDGDGVLVIDHLSGTTAYRLVGIAGLWLERLDVLLQHQTTIGGIFQAAMAPHPDQSGKA